jgi:hypothetical protein
MLQAFEAEAVFRQGLARPLEEPEFPDAFPRVTQAHDKRALLGISMGYR